MQSEPVCDPLYEPGSELSVYFYPVIGELLVLSVSVSVSVRVLSLQVDEVVQFEGRVVGAESAHDGEGSCGRWQAWIGHADELHRPTRYAVHSRLSGRARERSSSSRHSRCFRVRRSRHLSPSPPLQRHRDERPERGYCKDGARLLSRHDCVPLLGQPASVPHSLFRCPTSSPPH